jgi:hypothetical protein
MVNRKIHLKAVERPLSLFAPDLSGPEVKTFLAQCGGIQKREPTGCLVCLLTGARRARENALAATHSERRVTTNIKLLFGQRDLFE